jgi:glycosyltransferase involved in cell wall biosynthesis
MQSLPEGYIEKSKRKKILLMSDDLRMTSGIATMSREIVIGTSHRFNWVNLGAAINHPDYGKRFDLSEDTNKTMNIPDSSVTLYPCNGYGTPEIVRQILEIEKPDAIMLFTDPRYWVWLFQMENEIRKKIPILYLSIWDDYPAPLYNKPYYESCDLLMSISKQTKNIHELVLGEKAKDKVITYVPHGINDRLFYPINEFMKEEYEGLQSYKKNLFGEDQPEFVVFYNARNIRRKCTSDLIAAYALFCDSIGKEKAKKCTLLLHTQAMDENGTNLNAVVELLCDPEYQKVKFEQGAVPTNILNYMYNIADVTALISSNEGWGLSLTESMMAGTMIIANVTGGMQDQLRFEDEKGNWVDFTKDFPSNHFGKYRQHGVWAMPVFPTNMSIVGSIPTPYIFDDRCDFRDVANAIENVYNLTPEDRIHRGMKGRDWATSDESMMSSTNMSKNVISSIEKTFSEWKPKEDFEFIKIEKLPRKKITHKLVY